MKKGRHIKQFIFTILIFHVACLFFPLSARSDTSGLKTSYKRYSILSHKNEDILCEPYTVKQNDWLYKIFRKKGEISEKDFPSFISIFKEINPEISNIDAIEPGINIMIPLKKINKEDYDLSTPESVDVPVVEFSTITEDLDLNPYLKKHRLRKGETVSKLMHREFLQKGGNLSKEGLKIFQRANPHIKNINIIYEGTDIYLPDPAIRTRSWFQSFLSKEVNPFGDEKKNPKDTDTELDEYKLARLKNYSSLIGGILLNQGKLYFPREDRSPHVIDLSVTPIIETRDGTKILILSGDVLSDEILESMQIYWKHLKIKLMTDVLKTVQETGQVDDSENITAKNKKLIQHLLSGAGFDYAHEARIPFTVNHINLEASFGRVIRKDSTDLLINFGNVYGSALEVLEKQAFEILSITPELTETEVIRLLFSHLGYLTWQNPSFSDHDTVETLDGVYAVKDQDRLFIPVAPLSAAAISYLEKENIKILSTEYGSSTP